MKATDYATDSSFPPIPAEADEGQQGHVVAHNEFRDVFAYVAAHQPSRYNAATGGSVKTVSNYNGTGQTWRVHTFTGSGTFTVQEGKQPFHVLLVGGGGYGGGGAGSGSGGGGGGGGVLEYASRSIEAGAHAVSVGSAGKNTTFTGLTARAGGNGGVEGPGGSGASGGGGGGIFGTGKNQPGGSATQGHNGGTGVDGGPWFGGGGGGGASSKGGNPTSSHGGNGGAAKASTITGSTHYYGGGGAGVTQTAASGFRWGSPGSGGGGNGNGVNGTGGGGGAGGASNRPGGSGVVIIAYQIG